MQRYSIGDLTAFVTNQKVEAGAELKTQTPEMFFLNSCCFGDWHPFLGEKMGKIMKI